MYTNFCAEVLGGLQHYHRPEQLGRPWPYLPFQPISQGFDGTFQLITYLQIQPKLSLHFEVVAQP
jgi:hypothetical protein